MDTRATVELGVLGALRARATGVEVDIGPPQRRTVLAVLICGASQVIPTGRLLDCVWDDTASPSAIGSLHTHVSRLRKELGPDVIVRHPYGYALQLRPDQLDADVFSSWVRRGRSSVAKGQLHGALSLLCHHRVMTTAVRTRSSALVERASGWVIGGARILAGLLWLANLHWKIPPTFGEDSGGGLYKYAESVTRNSTWAPFTWVTEKLILPNFRFFGWVTLVVEILLALLLLVGYRTRIVALVGAAWSVPILLSVIYFDGADEWSWSYLMMIGLHLLLFATDAGRHLGLDGVLGRGGVAAQRALTIVGSVAIGVGVLGLFVARSVSFVGSEAALLGSDAGFADPDGGITRRWELKFVFFNPLWALLTILLGVLLVIGSRGARMARLALAGGAGFGVIAVVVFITQSFDYLRDDGGVQVVSTASNAALWGAFALAGVLLARRSSAVAVPASDG